MATAEAANRLGTQALEIRDACLAALATIDETPEAYLYPGLPPVEVGPAPCDGMLAVYVQPLQRTPWNMGRGAGAALGEQKIVRLPSVTYNIVYARCVDVWGLEPGMAPDAAQLDAEGFAHMRSGWVLMNGVHHAVKRGMILSACKNYDLGALNPLAVSGQSAGWTFTLTAQMDGYDPYA